MSQAHDIEERAAQWVIRREQPDWSDGDAAQLDVWLNESTAHRVAFWRLEHGWQEADRIASLGVERELPRFVAARWQPWAMAASLAALISIGGVQWNRMGADPAPKASVFATRVGARKVIPLVDGSRVELNTASAVRTAVTEGKREVWLDRGEAYFEIAHLRTGQPFVVHAGDRTVTVLGTKFSVRRDGDRVTVSVIEGKVRVEDADKPDAVPAAIITAGGVAMSRGSSTLLAANSEEKVAASLGWRAGLLNFDRTSLSAAAAEFNRYNTRQIVIGDSETGEIRIGGSFQAANMDAFVRLLHDAYGLRVEQNEKNIKISS